ncbi:hypothetical protein D3C81_595400 [compost metagenome]
MEGINQAAWWIVTVRLMIEVCVVHADLIAGKPAPTGLVVAVEFEQHTDTVGAGLPAMGPGKSPQTRDQLPNPAATNNSSIANKSGTFAT